MTRPGARLAHAPTGHVLPSWTLNATCAELPPDVLVVFFPESQLAADAARAICAVCPVDSGICAAYGDRISRDFGIFGGRTPLERKRAREGRVTV